MAIAGDISIPAQSVGVGLKPAHYRDAISPMSAREGAGAPLAAVSFFEVHAENYMGDGGPPHAWLSAIREHYPLSVHGVCLSIGGRDPIDRDHLARLKSVVDRYEPALISEHLAWCAHDGVFYNDLIAPPLTRETFTRVCDHVDQIQEALGRKILIENPSLYLNAPGDMSEPAFLNDLARHTGCGLLLDINNVVVSAHNLGFNSQAYVDDIRPAHVAEIHLAGHAVDKASGLRIDDHGSTVSDETGALYRAFVKRAGPRPTLIEWDTDTPPLAALVKEAEKAAQWMTEAMNAAAEESEIAYAPL